MLSMFSMAALIALGVGAHAMPLAPLASVTDATVIQAKMSCHEMMRMHHKMMGGKKMTCKEMMRMHERMMGHKA